MHQIPKLNDSRFVLLLSLPNPLKPGVKLRMTMYIGDAPTTSEWSTILLLSKVRLILEVWQYITEAYLE